MTNICIIGGGSTSWTPVVATDLMRVFQEPIEFRLVDIDPKAADLCRAWGRAATRKLRRHDRFVTPKTRSDALRNADAVIITINTGGLDADERDLRIAEKYRIYPTVGDSTGPTGWGRALRNGPVFMQFAEDFARYCPHAFIANYSNPMAHLTLILQKACANPVVGLCHSYHQTKRFIRQIFGLKNWDAVSLSIVGVNHFHWVVDFRIGHEPGYELLKRKIGRGSLGDLIPHFNEDIVDDHGKVSVFWGQRLCVRLYEAFGRLPYVGDRHTAEFLSFTLSGDVERYGKDNRKGLVYDTIRWCDIIRTGMDYRRRDLPLRDRAVREMISGKRALPARSSETVAEMIQAYIHNQPFTDAVNVMNQGQAEGLPEGCCVETMSTIDGLGVHPFHVSDTPAPILELLRRPALAHQWAVEGVMRHDKELLWQSLCIDPLCAHLKPPEVRAMMAELLEANKKYVKL